MLLLGHAIIINILLKNFHTLSYTVKQTTFIIKKVQKVQAEECISSPFVATLFGLPVSLKVFWYREEN